MTISFVRGKEIGGFLQRFLPAISAKAASFVFDEINAGVYPLSHFKPHLRIWFLIILCWNYCAPFCVPTCLLLPSIDSSSLSRSVGLG